VHKHLGVLALCQASLGKGSEQVGVGMIAGRLLCRTLPYEFG
jgi:hypothetical protein